MEENEVNDSSSKSSIETKPDASPQLPKKSITNSTLTSTGSSEAPVSVWAMGPFFCPSSRSRCFPAQCTLPSTPAWGMGRREVAHPVAR